MKSLDSAREKAQLASKIPTKQGSLSGAYGHIHDLIRIALLEGIGRAERIATSRHENIDIAAASWAWLLAADRASGQEWHFDSDARNKAGAWLPATKELLKLGKQLLECDDSELQQLKQQWHECLDQLKKATGAV